MCVCVCVSGELWVFTWQSVHCVPPGIVLLSLALRTARPTPTPGTICHTPNLNVFVWHIERGTLKPYRDTFESVSNSLGSEQWFSPKDLSSGHQYDHFVFKERTKWISTSLVPTCPTCPRRLHTSRHASVWNCHA